MAYRRYHSLPRNEDGPADVSSRSIPTENGRESAGRPQDQEHLKVLSSSF